MSSIFKTVLGVVIAAVIIYCGLGILWANNEAVAAENYLQNIGHQISEANLQESVILGCAKQAEENGYTLTWETVNGSDGYAAYVNLTLAYEYRVSIASHSGTHTRTMTVY
jgi:hypothetical protein